MPAAWSPLQDFGSPSRSAHAITYDSYRTRIALFGDESDPNNPQDHSATRGKHLRGRSLRAWLSTRTRSPCPIRTTSRRMNSRSSAGVWRRPCVPRVKRKARPCRKLQDPCRHHPREIASAVTAPSVVAQQLGLVNFPATAAVDTDLGAASTTLTLLPYGSTSRRISLPSAATSTLWASRSLGPVVGCVCEPLLGTGARG
jgi:hypothetical protein